MIETFLRRCREEPFSYGQAGATRSTPPSGFAVDHNRILIGRGAPVFQNARRSIREWRMFDIPWLAVHPRAAPVVPGTTVAVLASHFGFWSLNPCRIVYTMDDPKRFGFAYGTLVGHSEIGEERFSVEMDSVTGETWYDLYSFSRPAPLVRAGYPVARMLQRRFVRDSLEAMRCAVATRRSAELH